MDYFHSRISGFIENRIVIPLYKYIRLGLSPVKLTIAISVGATLGLCPLFGTTTILCGLIAIVFRLNMAVMQLVNYLMLPLQLIILIPLSKAGEFIFSSGSSRLTAESIIHAFKDSWFGGMKEMGHILLMGTTAWAIIIIPIGIISYFALLPAIKRISASNKAHHAI